VSTQEEEESPLHRQGHGESIITCALNFFSLVVESTLGYGVILGFVSERTIKDDNTNI
jgi:hypothetical protein